MKDKVCVLIIEDEKNISDILKFNLVKENYEVTQRFDGKEGLDTALEKDFDIVLLDIMLPSMDGFEICKKIREHKTVPIIMLTAKEEEVDKILGLELGADDYITKPFSTREVIARVKANVRRVEMLNTNTSSEILKFRDLEIDVTKYVVSKAGQEIKITFREFELLKYLAQHKEQVFSREQLLTTVWEYDYIGVDSERTVDVTVRRLREKIEKDPSNPEFIMTKRGVGYYFKS
ncbi:hypothetical protein HMPREF9630_01838 [Peptoanaerobacter stomatis]|uniref:Stage 0 sporulation protein A homolog n=1 Tax=Peptoanaerobacter stomatis TaxID=796937 RepID=J6HED4_9FIRM|nr:response regulator [Peptoanaerobacter stomatis]EHL16749.1 hypothetical protein HMPREF9630_01838 [Peptoanaerobacter stomatis]EJU23410.1 transcriptional regulatory protein YycF [Peptoanaerobacter stomatis]NWO24308.1 response regulator transcription factor [Peptostreptococcaceae bacterium oral taxon 081]